MDADLYDHLSTTITNDNQQRVEDNEDVENVVGSQHHPEDHSEPSGRDSTSSNSNNTRRQRTMSSSLPQELDQVVHAISSSPWAARIAELVGSVKKQVSYPFTFSLCCRLTLP
jgi:hypothetical protein